MPLLLPMPLPQLLLMWRLSTLPGMVRRCLVWLVWPRHPCVTDEAWEAVHVCVLMAYVLLSGSADYSMRWRRGEGSGRLRSPLPLVQPVASRVRQWRRRGRVCACKVS